MKRADLTEKMLDIKREKGWTWKHICTEIGGMSPVMITGAILGNHKMTKPQAADAALAAAIRLLRDVGIPENFVSVTQDTYSKNRLGQGPTKYYENAKVITGDDADVDRITHHVLGEQQ